MNVLVDTSVWILHHQVIVNDTQPVTGLSTINQEQAAILAALTIKKTKPEHPIDPLVVARVTCETI